MLQLEYVNKSKGDKNPEDYLEKISCDMGEDTSHILEIEPQQKSNSILITDKLNPNSSSYNRNYNAQEIKKISNINLQKLNNYSEISFPNKISQNLNNFDNSMKINFPNNFPTNKNKNKIKLTYENQNINLLKFSQDSFEKITIKEKELTEKEFFENNQRNKNDFITKKYTFPFKDKDTENINKTISKEEQLDGNLNFAKVFNHKMSMNYFTIHENEKKNFNMNTIHVFNKKTEKSSESEITSKNLKTVRNKSIGKSIDFIYSPQLEALTSKKETIKSKESTRNIIQGTKSSNSNLLASGTQAANQKFYKANYIKKSTSMTFVNSFVDEAIKLNKNNNFDTLNKINEKLEESYELDAGKVFKQISNVNDRIIIEDNKSEISVNNQSNVIPNNNSMKNKSIYTNNLNNLNNTESLKNLENFNTIITNKDNLSNFKSPIMSPIKTKIKSLIKSPIKPSTKNQIKSPILSPLKSPLPKENFLFKIDQKNAFKKPEIKNENYNTLSKNTMNTNYNAFNKPKKVASINNVNTNTIKRVALITENKFIKFDKNKNENLINKEVKILSDKGMEENNEKDFVKKNADNPLDGVKSQKTLHSINNQSINVRKLEKNAMEKQYTNNKNEAKLPVVQIAITGITAVSTNESIFKNPIQPDRNVNDTAERNKEMKMKKILNEFQTEDNYTSPLNINRATLNKDRKISFNKNEFVGNEEGNKKNSIFINSNKFHTKAKNSGGNFGYAKNIKK